MFKLRCAALLGGTLALLVAGTLAASVVTFPDSALIPSTNYYTDTIGGGIGNVVVTTGGGNAANVGDSSGRNDDGFSGPINLGYTLNFFGTDYTQIWVNNNGNISFNNGISSFTPNGPQGAPEPIISPFFADVDTRGTASGVVHIRQDIPNETIITWDNVGYFSAQDDKLDSFQLVLRGPNFVVPSGEGQIGFFYKSMQWEVGGASGGSGGFCPAGTAGTSCFPAAVGFGDGSSNGEILASSLQPGISSVVNDTHIWFDLSGGVPTPTVPEPATFGLVGAGIAALLFARLNRLVR